MPHTDAGNIGNQIARHSDSWAKPYHVRSRCGEAAATRLQATTLRRI
jgi:hypothetical protein